MRVNFDVCQLLGSFAEHQSLELLAITWISVRQVLYSSALAMGKKKIGSQGVNVGNAACGDIALLRAHNGSVLLHFWVFVPP